MSWQDQHDERLAGQRLALERAGFEAVRARRQFDAYEPEHRLIARTLERALEDPVDLASSLIDLPATKCLRRSSAHCSTDTTSSRLLVIAVQ